MVANSHSPERIHTTWSAFTDENTPRPVSFQWQVTNASPKDHTFTLYMTYIISQMVGSFQTRIQVYTKLIFDLRVRSSGDWDFFHSNSFNKYLLSTNCQKFPKHWAITLAKTRHGTFPCGAYNLGGKSHNQHTNFIDRNEKDVVIQINKQLGWGGKRIDTYWVGGQLGQGQSLQRQPHRRYIFLKLSK